MVAPGAARFAPTATHKAIVAESETYTSGDQPGIG
jgi:hypothetical protein